MRLDDGCVATGSKFQYSGGPVRSKGARPGAKNSLYSGPKMRCMAKFTVKNVPQLTTKIQVVVRPKWFKT